MTALAVHRRAARTTGQPAMIDRADVRLVRVPVEPPRGDAIQKFTALELPIVTLTDDAGRVGVGFGYTIGTGGSAILTLLGRELLPQLPGMDGRRITFIHRQLSQSIDALTPGCLASTALAAIDVALWDLAGRRAETPLWMLLGGTHDRVPIYNTDVGWLDRRMEEMLDLCRQAVERDGFRALKLKVGKDDPADDVERVARVCEAVGSRTKLMADGNQSWSVDEAIRRLRLLEPYELVWIEEPLRATDVDGFVALGRHTSIPRAGGESLYDPASFSDCVRRGARYAPPTLPGKALVQGHCHHKSIMTMGADEKLFHRLGLDYELLDSGCCGMAGSFGFERDHYDVSVAVGERSLLPRVRAADHDTLIVADGFSCREQIAQLTGRRPVHLAEVLDHAVRRAAFGDGRLAESRPAAPSTLATTIVMTAGALLVAGAAWHAVRRRAA